MSKRSDYLLLEDMAEAIVKIQSYTLGLQFEEFTNDNKTIDAVVRNFEIIGEATNRLTEEFKAQHAEVEWKNMVGLRNRLIHDYIGIDLFIVWSIIQDDLPDLLFALNSLDRNIH